MARRLLGGEGITKKEHGMAADANHKDQLEVLESRLALLDFLGDPARWPRDDRVQQPLGQRDPERSPSQRN